MELELGLALPNALPPPGVGIVGLLNGSAGACGKRVLGEAFRADKATLPLFVREDDDREMGTKRNRLVGWPPVKCPHWRSRGSGYVKVKMEGMPIGRKVDVSLHGSYEELLRTLGRMFPSANDQGAEDEEVARHERRRRHPYVVTYEDGEGDWLLVGDVPWEAFAKSVKRLRITTNAKQQCVSRST